ncbi:hypothetical protein Z043_111512 [Scleropages formosus]|uniref:Uncharacterized protein n=1 Tax=Scleropages formosus TaxID=113540 RepID=A0A0P7WZS2_SCLFO|nr:hypothetical protein Z043_111512 [Scleropages formosus]
MFYFQLVIMAGTVLLAYYFEYTDTFPVHIQGFFCYDKAFSKPYPGPEDSSKAPPVLVYSLVTAIPTVTVGLLPGVDGRHGERVGASERATCACLCVKICACVCVRVCAAHAPRAPSGPVAR